MTNNRNDLIHLARLALSGSYNDVVLLTRRLARRARRDDPTMAQELESVLGTIPGAVVRDAGASSIPLDGDSRMELARVDPRPTVGVTPIWSPPIASTLEQFVAERQREGELAEVGLAPTRTLLFTGPPGVGKTLAARWIAGKLSRPLVTLDLSTVMSSFLGRTGNNLRAVLDYAKNTSCVMLLDEFDAIAKKRDDATEIGELKRLVTVVLQEIEEWPITGVLVATTNHPDLLDPAVWRRFEATLEFPLPDDDGTASAIRQFLVQHAPAAERWVPALRLVSKGRSFSDIERTLRNLRRASVIRDAPLDDLLCDLVRGHLDGHDSRQSKRELIDALLKSGVSQWEIHRMTGAARETIRKAERGGGAALSAAPPDGTAERGVEGKTRRSRRGRQPDAGRRAG